VIGASRPVNKNVSTGGVKQNQVQIKPGVHKLLTNYHTGGYKFRTMSMSGWNGTIGAFSL